MNARRFLTLGAFALAGAAFAGCAQQVGDIDRTSPNRLEKSALEGEWYMMNTVIDTSSLALSSFAGLQGNMERVFFQIEEDTLLVRRTFEDVVGVDSNGINVPGDASWDGGSVVAAFPVQSHFDVQRSYNSATGEQSNVIVENASDRDWYEREYMRVDWSRQTIDGGWGSIVDTQNMAEVVVGPQDEGPETTWYVERNEDGEVYYIDVVTSYYVYPDPIECILAFGAPAWGSDCGPERVTARTSYLKVDPTNDYIARDYSEFDLNYFGYFTVGRCVFDRRYECTDSSRVQAAATWNIWQNHTDGNGNVLPYEQREVRPIAYYINQEWPLDVLHVAYESTEQWSYAFRRTVAALQNKPIEQVPRMFYACLNTGTEEEAAEVLAFADTMRNDSRAQLTRDAVAASNEGYANGACQDRGRVKNVGDLRYSWLNWVNNGAWVPWGGYGPSGQDPLTGETRQGGANINGQNYDWAAQRTLEIVKVINGELDPVDYGYGTYIRSYFDNLRAETNDDRYLGYLRTTDGSDEDAQQKSALGQAALQRRAERILERAQRADHLRTLGQDVLQRPHVQQLMQRPLSDFELRNQAQAAPLRRFAGTPFEQELLLPEVNEGLGDVLRRGGMSEEEVLNYISPARVGNMETMIEYGDRLRSRLLDRNIHLATDFDPYMLGFAREISAYRDQLLAEGMEPGPELDTELWMEIRAVILAGVVEHEIGHTVGLRHNFEASTDALNFFPQYWALRERTFDEDCDDKGWSTFNPEGLATGEVAPRRCEGGESVSEYALRAAEMLEEIRTGVVGDGVNYTGGIHEFQYSSIMDYDPKVNTHSSGIGLYDYAAIAYGYGDLVEVFDQAPFRLRVDTRYNDTTDDFESITVDRAGDRVVDMRDVDDYSVRSNGITDGDAPRAEDIADDLTNGRPASPIRDNPWTHWHYSVLPMMFDGIADSVNSAEAAQGYYPERVQYEGMDRMAGMYNRILVQADDLGAGDVRVPYRYCEDYREGASSTCAVFDLGADEYEMLTELMDRYDSYYVSTFFRRERRGFGLWLYPVVSSMLGRYYGPAIRYYQFWLINYSSRGFDWLNSEYGGLQQYNAALEGVNFVGQAFSNPTVGTYVFDQEEGTFLNVSDDPNFRFEAYDTDYPDLTEDDYLSIDIADGGRYGFSRFTRNEDGERGYHYFFETEVLSHFWAKYAALFAMTSGSIDLIGVDTDSDSSSYFIPPYLVFEEDMTNFFGALITGDFNDIGHCVTEEDGEWVAQPIDLIRGTNDQGCLADGGTPLNPYTNVYGNRDYNMQYFAPVVATANFDATLDTDWFDNAGIYVWGTGDQPGIYDEGSGAPAFEWMTYTDDLGTTYAARAPAGYDITDRSAVNARVGYEMVAQMVDLRVERDFACPFQFDGVERDLARWCGMTVAEADTFIADNGPYTGRDFYEINNDLDNAREIARHIARTNSYFTLIDGEVAW